MTSRQTDLLRGAADLLEERCGRATGGSWETSGLLASRPEVVARYADGSSEHVAEARARSAAWIVTVSPSVAPPLVDWLRATAEAVDVPADVLDAATRFAAVIVSAGQRW